MGDDFRAVFWKKAWAIYDIPAEFGTEFEAAEECSHTSLMTYYNDIHRDMAAIFSCVNGCVFHS